MKKNEKFLSVLGTISDKYVAEADITKSKKGFNIKKFAIIAACFCLVFTSLNLWLFLPLKSIPKNISMYKDSKYFSLIEKLNAYNTCEPQYKNNFAKIVDGFSNFGLYSKESNDLIAGFPTYIGEGGYTWNEEKMTSNNAEASNKFDDIDDITDNQVKGVIEADIIKRSDSHIFYLNNSEFIAYVIAGEESYEVGRFSFEQNFINKEYDEEYKNYYYECAEFFLTTDYSTAIFIIHSWKKTLERDQTFLNVIALDISNPEKITLKNTVKISGNYSTSRYVDGKLLLINELYVPSNADFSDEKQFLPQYDYGNGFESIPMENIISPDSLTSSRYAIISLLDADTLTLEGCTALLSYSCDVYVSKDTVYLTRGFRKETKDEALITSKSMTEICGISYSNGELKEIGNVTVDGYIKDQYSLDEHEGILRVVTTTSKNTYNVKETIWDMIEMPIMRNTRDMIEMPIMRNTSASLFCIDLSNWEIKAKVEEFAPVGETVRSVRFDGDAAYVCTAVQVTDPVFFFDLSDLDNITYKDTGDISGFSSSLINFKDGFLLGVGVASGFEFKLEVYEETADGVRSVCDYTTYARYSSVYKSYFIDRERGLIGLGLYQYDKYEEPDYYNGDEYKGNRYVLFQFDGYKLHEIVDVELNCSQDIKRAVLDDGFIYIIGGDQFIVEYIGIK